MNKLDEMLNEAEKINEQAKAVSFNEIDNFK